MDSLDHDTALLTTEAGAFRDAGAGIHSNFQGVAAFYKAPEAEQLFATTAPVAAKTATFADNLEKVSGALSAYSQEVRPLAKKLEDLQRQAFAFTASIQGDDHWQRDEKKRDRNDGLKNEVQATLQAFYEAEIACHNKITALVGGTTLVLGSYGEQKIVRMGTVEYGARAEDLSHMDKLPWGNYAEPEYTGVNWLWHQGKSLVWDGFIVDGIWGTVTGIDILLGCDGWDAAGEAWKGLAKVATGLAIMITPGANGMFMAAPDSMMPKWFRESRTALKETGKALIAYDEWGKNPARAAGGVTFNVLTTIFTGGAGAAAKGGAIAKTISVLGKVGRAVDPMTYVFKAGKFGVVKVADVFKGLKGLSIGPLADTAHLPHVTDTYAEWSDGTKLSFKDGEYTVTRPDGTKVAAHIELSADQIAQLNSPLPHVAETSLPGTKSPVLVAAGDRAGHGTLDNTTRDSVPGPTAAHGPPGDGRTHNTLSTGARAVDHPTGGGTSPHAPSGHGSGHSGDVGSGGGEGHTGEHGNHGSADHSASKDTDHGAAEPAPDPAHTMRSDYVPPDAPESKLPAPPKEHGDVVLATGDHVYQQPHLTTIGYDSMTQLNREFTARLDGYHDVIVHGNDKGFFMPGRKNAAGVDFPPGEVHPSHIVEAIRNNPSYNGGPIRLISCHTGRIRDGITDIPAAQQLANELGVPVMAPTDEVGIYPSRPKGQSPEVQNGGYWRIFLPIAK
ncbi:hypothetical protein [Streptomyces sp. NBC_01431]|uniref:hypothetical protein n=1 Tax=Streptomyces sp. NBC_01431 TaxID=2903863 RepID=UPI002E34609E|nr:hypothetical protein [Streptomyces sp. NBC_01431]